MWKKAEAGRELAQKSYDRIKNLYESGVVPAQKFDEASANLQAMKTTAQAAQSQYNMAVEGARLEDKTAAAALVAQATGAVSEVGIVRQRRHPVFADRRRSVDGDRRTGRADRLRLSGHHPARHERPVGDVQRQGRPVTQSENRIDPHRLCAGTGQKPFN